MAERFGILPERFHLAHLFCQRLSDRLVDLHRHLTLPRFWDINVAFQSEEHATAFAQLADNEGFDWLAQHGYAEVVGDISLKLYVAGLLGDMCQFVYEALGASARGKTTVAFALFRKPLKDSLFYLEWMLAEPAVMLNAVVNNVEPADIALHSVAMPSAKGVEVIKLAKQIAAPGMSLDPEFLWQIRFDKSVGYSLEHYWQRALHLVTHSKHVKSAPGSMNFIFDGDDDRDSDWITMYSTVPLLLYYAVAVCEALLGYATGALMPDYESAFHERAVGFVLWGRGRQRFATEVTNHEPTLDLGLECGCGASFVEEKSIRRLYVNRSARCRNCWRLRTIDELSRSSSADDDR